MKKGNHKVDTYVKAFDWLHELYLSEAFAKVVWIYGLVKEEIWENYKILGAEGLREQELLKEYSLLLQKAWKNKRPRLFGPDKVEECLE